MIGVFIFALQVFGIICGYTHQISLKITLNFSLHDSFLPANLKGIDIRIIGSFWSHVQAKRCSSRRRRGRHVRRCAFFFFWFPMTSIETLVHHWERILLTYLP